MEFRQNLEQKTAGVLVLLNRGLNLEIFGVGFTQIGFMVWKIFEFEVCSKQTTIKSITKKVSADRN
jgi:hypothetical protein